MVYVDTYEQPYGPYVMSHMIADTTDELLEMVDAIGVKRKHIQYAGTDREHFDVCLTKRAAAVRLGARLIHPKELVWRTQNRDVQHLI